MLYNKTFKNISGFSPEQNRANFKMLSKQEISLNMIKD